MINSLSPLSASLHGEFHPWNEISARLLKQILLKSNCQLHGEGFSPGHNSARAKNPSPVFSNWDRIFSPANRAEKNHAIAIIFFIPGQKRNASMRIDCDFAPQ